MRITLATATIALGLALSACGSGDPVQRLIEDLEEAVESRDADAIRELLGPDFRTDSGSDRDETHSTLKRLMLGYETVSLEVLDLVVEPGESATAQVSCAVGFSGRARPIGGLAGLLPPGSVYRFELGVAEQAGTWRVTSAAWQPVETRVQ